jgi:hypothetical protein
MTARTYVLAPVSVVVSKKSAAMMAWAWERRNVAQVVLVRWGAGSIPASLRISHTVEAATATPRTSSSPWILRYPHVLFAGQAQDQPADRPDGSWPPDPGRPGDPGVPSRDQVTVPAQHGLRSYQQPNPAEYARGSRGRHSGASRRDRRGARIVAPGVVSARKA